MNTSDGEEGGSEGSWFRFSPRWAMRTDGDPIFVGDQITLACVKLAGARVRGGERDPAREGAFAVHHLHKASTLAGFSPSTGLGRSKSNDTYLHTPPNSTIFEKCQQIAAGFDKHWT